jgi:succinate dehydrogenase / fumarate reductase cytochrome b subunit
MIQTGLVMLAFVVFHLAHFTWRMTDQRIAELGPFEVHRMMVIGFQQPLIAGSYVLAMIAIGMHLSHGVSSIFQTLGLNHPRYNGAVRKIGPAIGIAIAALFASIPLSIYFRLAP